MSEPTPPRAPVPVQIVGVQIPFLDLVGLLVKLALAAIPALLFLSVIGLLLSLVLAGLVR